MTTPFQPLPCDAGGGGGSDAIDTEQTLLCDVMPNGDVVGSALAVYEYDATGAPVGAPTFVDPVTGLPYVPQGVLQPCSDTLSHAVEILCDVNDVDGSSVTFERVKTIGPAGTVLSVADFGLDGAPYVPQFSVQLCDPHATCTPDSNLDLNADCGPGEAVTQQILLDDASAPLSNAVFNDDDTADPLCGGTWDRTADDLPPGFPVAESFRNTTFDQPGPVTQANWAGGPFLTAGPPTNDGAGAGWIRLSDGSYASGGVWQVPTPFSTSQGMNAAVTLASHDGTTPGGDGQYFVFTDGSAPPQSTIVGGFGNLGLNNIDAGVFAVVLDEYGQSCTCGQAVPSDPNPGACGFCSNTISIQRAGTSRVGASCACCTIASAPLAPKAINQTTRSAPLRLLTSVISEGGQTYVSASIDWNDGNGPVQYFDRVNITACIAVPPTLRMGLVMNSGGAFQAVKEARDAVARPAGVSNWRAFPIVTDPIPACVTLVNISASVDVTPTDDGTQTTGNGNPEAYFWLVNTATNTVVDRDQYSIIPTQLGQVKTLKVSASVPVADLPNLRLYVGAESRDEVGEYSTTWENLTIDATGAGCPATPRRTMEISARCPIPVTIVGGGTGEGGGGGTTVVNTPSTFEDQIICATVGGVPQTAFRREVRTPDGGVEVTFLGFNGLPITPDGGWTPGPCPTQDGQTLGPVCWVSNPPVGSSRTGFMTLDANGDPVLYDTLGAVVPAGTYTIVICPLLTQQSHILCDAGNNDHPFMRWYVDSPILGQSDQQWDFELDGSTPYVPVGPVGACSGACSSCQTLTLCDFGADVPVLISGISTGGTLSNGVTWSGARGSAALFNPQHNNADGSWWGMPSFPNSTVAPDTWFFDRPVDVEFSVVIAHSFGTGSGAINSVQVPIGSELVSAAADYSYDVATGIVTVDATNDGDCTKVTNPTVAKSARFRLRNVSQFSLDFLGQRIAICGQFSNWRFGSIAVTPATTTFLRTVCRDCDGAVTTVTDTQADGTTPYVAIGPVGDCGTPADAEPSCFATQICVQPQGVQEFISNAANLTSTVAAPNIDPVWQWSNDPVAGPWFNMYDVGVFPGWVTVDPGTTQGVANWVAPHPNSSPNNAGLPGEGPTIGPGNAEWYARAQFTLPASADPASIRIAATVLNADQLGVEFRLNGGAWQPVGASHTAPPFSFPAQVIPGAQAGVNNVIVHVRETVFGSGAAGVKMHLIASYNLGDPQSWTQIVCDDGTVSYFTNAGEQADALPADWVIVPCAGGSSDAVAPAIRDSEAFVLCSSTPTPGTQFIRNRVYNELGVVVATVDTTLTGAPFVPGVVSVCTQSVATDFDFIVQPLCDSNGTAFFRRLTFNSATGAVTSTTDTTLAGAAFVPVGAVGLCSNCCPTVVGNGCTNVGSGFYTAVRATNGTISLLDSVTGAAVLAANIVACPSDNTTRTLTAQGRVLTNATPWTPGGDVAGTLTSLTVTGVGGLWDVVDANGTAMVGLPAGLTLTWSAEDDNRLLGPTSVTPQAGASVVANWTQV